MLAQPVTMAELQRVYADLDLADGLEGGVLDLAELGLVDLL